MKDDKTLYKEFLKGNIESFEDLVIQHKDNLIYFISRYTGGDMYTAEDIAQDVFAYIFVYKEKYDLNYSFKTFIYTLGKNKAIDAVRKLSRSQLTTFDTNSEYLYPDGENIEEKIIKDEEHRNILVSLKKLSPNYQRVLYLFAFENLPYNDIAKILGKTLPQTKVLIHRARKSLKSIIEKGEGEYED
ncbi:MAG: RNA polymerase sigma factor [Tissierellia bacterium]|jgi:RNA polymerase sigma-70 factor (ECF subfamily)|nr:RNA polymerase sigma factor [Tissierellia bacterium]